METPNCCGLNLTDGICPTPVLILLRQGDATLSIACVHPCAKVRMYSATASISAQKEVTLSLREVPLDPPESTGPMEPTSSTPPSGLLDAVGLPPNASVGKVTFEERRRLPWMPTVLDGG